MRVTDWLLDYLQAHNGVIDVQEATQAAEKEGISPRVLQQASFKLGLVVQVLDGGRWYWRIPEHTSNTDSSKLILTLADYAAFGEYAKYTDPKEHPASSLNDLERRTIARRDKLDVILHIIKLRREAMY